MALPAPLTEQQILDQARTSVQNQIGAQTAPLQSQIGTLQSDETRALQGIGGLYDHIQPAVQQSAQAVDDSYRNAESVQNSIFAQANQRLNALKQDRASEAQRMAQQIGGPVAINEFTAGMDP